MVLSIISINYKQPGVTIASMESLWQQFEKKFKNKTFEYIVVDNHSEDESIHILKRAMKKYTGFSLIENGKNSGFGAGNNLGESVAKGSILLFLNNDTMIKTRGIQEMLAWIQAHDTVGILGGELKNIDGSMQVSQGPFYTIPNVILLLLGLQRFGFNKNPKKIQQVDWVKGGCLMIKKMLFEKLQGFDEKIFMYGEDMELCFRAKAMGFRTYFYPDSGVLHKEHGSSNRSNAIVNIYKSMLYFYKKHHAGWEYSIVKMLFMIKACILIGIGKILRNSYLSHTYEKALAVC